MKTLKFRPELAGMILRGEKTATFRLFDDKDIRTGDELTFVNWETKEPFAAAVVRETYERTLGTLTEDDFAGHEKYANQDSMYATLRTFYGDAVGPDTVVKVIRFELR